MLQRINPFRLPLAWQMTLATAFGIFFGLFFGSYCQILNVWASAYIMILKVTTIPYLACAIIHGVGQLTASSAKEILKKGIIFIGCAWILNLILIYLIAYLFPEARGEHYGSYFPHDHSSINFAELLIPENIFYSLTNNVLPAIVVFSILIGIALMFIKEKQPFMHSFQISVDALTRITSWISRITPLGTFIILASQFGTIQFSTFEQIGTYLFLYVVSALLLVFLIFPAFVGMLTSISPLRWIKDILSILLLAYTTNAVIVCLPFIIELIKREIYSLHPSDEKAQNQIQGIVSIVFNLPLGSLFLIVFVLFASLFYHIQLTLGNHLELILTSFLASLGAVGLGAWINILTFLLDSLGLPLETLQLYLTTLPFTAGFQSVISAMEITTLSLFITFACKKQIYFQWKKLFLYLTIILLPLFLFVFVVKTSKMLPNIVTSTKTIFDVTLSPPQPEKEAGFKPGSSSRESDILERILSSKTLKIGYNTNVIPYCFLNRKKEIVGYDIAFAYQLAQDLGCKPLLVPIDYAHLDEQLNNHLIDIAMSSVSITEQRLSQLSFTEPYMEEKLVFVVKDAKRKEFVSIENVREKKFSIAVFKGSSFEKIAMSAFPENPLIKIPSYAAFAKDNTTADALLWTESKAISWTLRFPAFTVVYPSPSLGSDLLAYALAFKNAERFLDFMNQWLLLKKAEGFTEKQYNLWILGKTETTLPPEPRWSILRDVLHWVD